ncbi:MAG: RNA methyltransferase [Planctomycetia bacterium]|nr:RNA methyltransferase [Planctomycetia bacterium]
MSQRYFATCGRGIEPLLANELLALNALDVTPGRGGVSFSGDRALMVRANLWLRTAVRVLWPILEAKVESPDELYQVVQTVDWTKYLTPDHTLAVDSNVRDSRITHSKYAALRVKDAICDQFVSRQGRRPSVDVVRPMVALNLHLYRNHAILSLDSSGESLHKRGYRPHLTVAPLNEALAAALVMRSGWTGDTPFFDPLCGGAVLPIEAAWLAMRRPAGLTRKHFGFMGWLDYRVAEWAEIRDEARRGVLNSPAAPVRGSDLRADVVAHAERNASAAGIGHAIKFERADVQRIRLDGPPGVVMCNPPYGERIGEEKELIPLYRSLGDLAKRSPGWKFWVFTGNPRLAQAVGLTPREEIPFYNGRIPCRLLRFGEER